MKHFPIFTLVVILALSQCANVHSQTMTNYTGTSFSATAGTYTAITGSTVLLGNSSSVNDDGVAPAVALPFDFWLNGTRYSHFAACVNGWIRLGQNASVSLTNPGVMTSAFANDLGDATNTQIIAPMWDDLYILGNSYDKVHYVVTGVAPSRVLTVEWCYVKRNGSGGAPQNFQVKLYEGTGVIKFVYGTCSTPSSASASCGFTGGTGGSGNFVSASGFSTSTTLNTTTAQNNITGTATVQGLTYTFTPPTTTAPTGLSISNVHASSMTLNWTNNGTHRVGTAIYASIDNVNYIYQAIAGALSASANITGLMSSTLYYFKVYAVSEGYVSAALSGSQATIACAPQTGIISVGPTGSYAGITQAISELPSCGYSGNLILELQPAYTCAGETFPIAFTASLGTNPSKTITIRPATGATNLILTSNAAAGTISMNGAVSVVIDGRPGGTGTTKQLIIENTSTTGFASQFINDASGNTIEYVTLKGVNTSYTGGVVLFGGTTGTTGNDNNTIDNCDVRDGTSTPTNGIYASGTAGKENGNNTISNCNIFNFFNPGVLNAGITIAAGNTDWTITHNSFYQTSTRTCTGANTCTAITIANGSGNNFAVTNNSIGGDSPGAMVTTQKWTINGGYAVSFNGISLSAGSTRTSTIQGNTITNLSVLSAASSATTPWFAGITITGGNADVGTSSGNTVGCASGTGSIILTQSVSTGGFATGIQSSSTGTLNISNNTIGSLTLTSTGTTLTTGFSGIRTTAGANTISLNTIGNTSTAMSISSDGARNSTTNAASIRGISQESPGVSTIANNTIANIAYAASGGTGPSSAIALSGIAATAGSNTLTGNQVKGLSSTSGNTGTGGSASVIGMAITSPATGGQTVSQNTVQYLSNTAAAGVTVTGILENGPASGPNTTSGNMIHSLSASNTGATLNGIAAGGGTATYVNNMVRLGIDSTGNSLTVALSVNGINETAGNNNFWYNTICIGGNSVGSTATNTFAFNSSVTANTRNFRNNIFVNGRSNATTGGKHYATKIAGTAAYPPGLTMNYNIFNVTGTGGVLGFFNNTDVATLSSWRTLTGMDLYSLTGDPGFMSVADMHINSSGTNSWNVRGRGVAISSASTDYDGDERSISPGTPTDIGADEFTHLDGIEPNAATESAPPAANATTSYTDAGRKLADITWHSAGSLPSSVSLQYFPGVPPPGAGGLNCKSYWKISASGGSGYLFDLKLYYTPAEGGTINPGFHALGDRKVMAPGDSTPWAKIPSVDFFAATPPYTINSATLSSPALFTLTADDQALPIQLASFTGTRLPGRSVQLNWTTISESNNYGFDVQTRNDEALEWWNVAGSFVAGHGTTNLPQHYAFTDITPAPGSPEYRLKQVDLDGAVHFSAEIKIDEPAGAKETARAEFLLQQNFPNPFNPSTGITFSVERTGHAKLEVFTILGQKVASLFDGEAEAGHLYSLLFDGKGLASGIYICSLQSSTKSGVRTMLLLK